MYRSKNKPRRWRPKPKPGTPGGEYNFVHHGKAYSLPGKFVQDATSPSDDGLRWIGTAASNKVIRFLVCKMAGQECQVNASATCWGWAPVDRGHPHHVIHKKMGGAFTDDRIWLTIDGEVVQIRVWSCPTCHQKHHGLPVWSREKREDAA